MAPVVGIVSRHGLTIEMLCRNQPKKSKLALYNLLIHYIGYLKQFYISNKAECFSYSSGCDICVSWHSKEELVWVINKWLWFISSIILFETVIWTSKELRNKTILSLKQY